MKSVRKFTWGRRNKITEHREKVEPVNTFLLVLLSLSKRAIFYIKE